MTTYAGIDYGLGKSNVDNETGIRFGVISQHSPSPEATDDIYNGRNLSFEHYQNQVKANLRAALGDYFSAFKGIRDESRLDVAVRDCFEAIEQDIADNYQSDNDAYRYESDGYIIETSSLGLYVIKSPYYTFAQFCSPCCPGAGNLDTPCADGPKTYCLGHDWFDDSKAPYPVYSVATGEPVNPQQSI